MVSVSHEPNRKKATRTRVAKTLSSGIVPIFRDPTTGKKLFLLLRCFNYWDFPKGGLNPNEAPLDAAIRELQEETTLKDVVFPWGLEFRETPVYAQGKVARYYLGEVFSKDVSIPINPQIGRAEHHEFRWFTFAEAHRVVHDRVRDILVWANEKTKQAST